MLIGGGALNRLLTGVAPGVDAASAGTVVVAEAEAGGTSSSSSLGRGRGGVWVTAKAPMTTEANMSAAARIQKILAFVNRLKGNGGFTR
jgi:hypothetical protein